MNNLSAFKAVIGFILLFAITAQGRTFETGDAVTTLNNYNAAVIRVISNNVVEIKYLDGFHEGETRESKTEFLSKRIYCLRGICANDMVTTPNPFTGVVVQVFADGTVKVKLTTGRYAGGTYEYEQSALSLYQKCSQSGGTNCQQ